MNNKLLFMVLFLGLNLFLSAQTVSTFASLSGGIAFDTYNILYVTAGNQSFSLDTSGVVNGSVGTGTAASVDGYLTAASFNGLFAIACGAQGIFLTELNGGGNGKVRKVSSTNGMVTTLASGFNTPKGIALDAVGNVYVADTGNNRIQKITPSGVVTTLAGSASAGMADGMGVLASFNQPNDVAVDASGNVFVADGLNNKIRKISPAGLVTTYAGTGSRGNTNGLSAAASFFTPYGLAIDATGNVYVADIGNNKIRKITPLGIVSTFAGTGISGSTDGSVAIASFNQPYRLAFDSNGNLYIAETDNKIRKITIGPLSNTSFNIKTAIKISPNPTHDEVTLELNSLNNPYLEIFDSKGQLVRNQSLSNLSKINIAEMAAGVYIFKVTSNEGTTSQKVVKY